jgi:tight adherence protein B
MSTTLLLVIILSFFILLVGGVAVLGLISTLILSGNNLQDRFEAYAVLPETQQDSSSQNRAQRFVRLRVRVNYYVSRFASRQLNDDLLSANWRISVSEFILIRLGVTFLAFLLGWLLIGSFLSGLGLAILTYLIPGIILRRSLQQRRIRFANQLVDVLVLVTGAVRSGYSLLQALDLVVEETKAPAAEEFRRVTRQVGLGISLSDALNNLALRMDNPDLTLVVTSININNQVGGNMSVMLETVTETIRDRMRLFGEIRVLTTHQRFTGYMLTILPFIVGGLLFFINPDYMEGLFTYTCVPVGAIVMVLLGNLIVRQMLKVDV